MLCGEREVRAPQEPRKPELASVFREHRNQLGPLTTDQERAIQAIMDCRTAALGGHVSACDTCGHQDIAYNSCRNRHCPKCGALAQARWIERQEHAVLPAEYHHVVFTVPDVLNPLFRADPARAYRLLFAAASETLIEIAANPRHLGAQIGFTAVLHTWTQTLLYHPHVHCIVPGGGLAPTGRWRNCRRGFFLPVAVLAKVYRGKLLRRLQLACGGDPNAREALRQAASKRWVVFSKPPVTGAQQVLRYLGRYTQRSAISDTRILAFDDGEVTFRYRDRADANRSRTMTLAATEFLRRVLLHVLPKGFVRIRHYGLLANCNRAAAIAKCRDQLRQESQTPAPLRESWSELLHRLTGVDVTRCPSCKQGRLVVIAALPAMRFVLQLPGRATSP
jgi:hypothetical protein